MTDPVFVAGAYIVVIGGLAAYVASVFRRRRAVLRRVAAIERERLRGPVAASRDLAAATDSLLTRSGSPGPVEVAD